VCEGLRWVKSVRASQLGRKKSWAERDAGVAIRSGHHCTQPLHTYLGISASARASPYIYNTTQEVDVFISELKDTIHFFKSME
jgi:selenocysteine lyase/cysteine desulfurase